LKRDFFKRHDIQIIESMPNGKDYVLFYLKLLAESVDHEGCLRFSNTIPYNEQMLSTITNTNVDVVKSALEVFKGLNLIEFFDDQTIFMDEVSKMLGSESWSAERTRRWREKMLVSHCDIDVTLCDEEKELEKELEIDKSSKEDYCPNKVTDVSKISKSTLFEHDSNPYKLAAKLSEMIHINNPDAKQQNEQDLQRWSKVIDLMIRRDKRTPRQIYDVLYFSQTSEFWRSNILSASKLREQYDRLKLQMEDKK
jgi:predicted phage replisome organizer